MIKATLNREFGRELTNDKVVAVQAKNSNCKIANVAEENKVSLVLVTIGLFQNITSPLKLNCLKVSEPIKLISNVFGKQSNHENKNSCFNIVLESVPQKD